MSQRNKDVIVYRFDPKAKYFLVSMLIENKPGTLGSIADLLAVRGMNILEGYFGRSTDGTKGTLSFFLETQNRMVDEGWLKEYIGNSVYVSEVEVKEGVEGFLADSLNFPLTWNNGQRAVLMRVEPLQAMIDAVKQSDPGQAGGILFGLGFGYGKNAWATILQIHTPRTKEGLAEMMHIYDATGWGRAELVEYDAKDKRAVVRLKEGFECMGLSTGACESHFVRGHLAGVFSSIFGSKATCQETKCLAKGDSYCEFKVSVG